MKFKKFTAILLAVVLLFIQGRAAFALSPALPDIVSEAYCVMDARTGQVLLQKNKDKTEYPASITKILSAALALERLDPADRYTFSKEAATYDLTGTHLAFVEGEEVSVEDLLCGMMLASANDAAQGLAEAAAGSEEAFVALMNEKARELGALGSNFTNPSGYHDGALVSTAYDMALITRWALTVEGFRDYFGRWDYVIGPTNIKDESRTLGTYHSMIVGPENNPVFGYEGASGGKLGWTPEATHTIVTVAERDGVELICVALKSTNQYAKYKDSIALFDYCFENFGYVAIPGAGLGGAVPVVKDGKELGVLTVTAPELEILLPKSMSAGDVEASSTLPDTAESPDESFFVTLSFKKADPALGSELAVLPLLTEYSEKGAPAAAVAEEADSGIPVWAAAVLTALGVLIVLAAAVLIIRRYNIRKYERLRAKRRARRARDGRER